MSCANSPKWPDRVGIRKWRERLDFVFGFFMKWKSILQSEALGASLLLVMLLNVVFFPALWGGKTLMLAAWDVASITPEGAYYPDHPQRLRIGRPPMVAARAGLRNLGSRRFPKNIGVTISSHFGTLTPHMGRRSQLRCNRSLSTR